MLGWNKYSNAGDRITLIAIWLVCQLLQGKKRQVRAASYLLIIFNNLPTEVEQLKYIFINITSIQHKTFWYYTETNLPLFHIQKCVLAKRLNTQNTDMCSEFFSSCNISQCIIQCQTVISNMPRVLGCLRCCYWQSWWWKYCGVTEMYKQKMMNGTAAKVSVINKALHAAIKKCLC